MRLFIHASGYGRNIVPPLSNPQINKVWIPAKQFAPLRMREGLSVVCNKSVFSSVVVLLLIGCPPAIFWTVVSICIDSIKRHSCWFIAHVFDEVFKRINPSFTNRNTPSAVTMKLCITHICASLLHSKPAFVFRGFRFAMNKTTVACRFCGKASAGYCRSTFKVVSGYLLFVSAFAFAHPANFSSGVFNSRNNRKSPENVPGKVFCSSHFVTSKLVTIDVWQAVVKLLFGSYPSQKLGY